MAKVTFIARMTVKPDKRTEFIGLCRRLEEYTRAHEPDTLAYEFFKLRDADRYAVLESFRDTAAEERHMTSSILAELGPRLSSCLIGTWEREYFDALD